MPQCPVILDFVPEIGFFFYKNSAAAIKPVVPTPAASKPDHVAPASSTPFKPVFANVKGKPVPTYDLTKFGTAGGSGNHK